MFRRSLIAIVLLSLASCVSTLTYHDFEDPVFFANQRAGGTCIECPIKSGLLVAIWPDGRILRAHSEASVGYNYIYGHLSELDTAYAIEQVQELYESNIDSPGVIIDSSYRDIWIFPVRDQDQSAMYFYTIGVEEFRPEVVLRWFMDMEIVSGRALSWDQLPRFGAGVKGVWTTR